MAFEHNAPAESGPISRRTIVKGAAWAAPVMIAAVAVPAAVASTKPTGVTPIEVFGVTALKELTFTVANAPAGTSVTVGISGSAWKLGQTPPRRTSTVLTTGTGGVVKVWVDPGSAATATLSFSGGSGTTAWGPFTSTLRKAAS